ncbi:MAG: FtsB family cell division protein [Mangrovibacterium sp.]
MKFNKEAFKIIFDNTAFRIVFNKWTITIYVLICYILWLNDEHVLSAHLQRKEKLQDMQQQEIFLTNKITRDSLRLIELQSDRKNVEKFAREQFYMHAEDEDVFIVIEED